MEHQIIRDHETNRSRGFGFIIFDNEETVDEMLSNGNMIDMAGTQVSLSKWFQRNKNGNRFLCVVLHEFFLSISVLLLFKHNPVFLNLSI